MASTPSPVTTPNPQLNGPPAAPQKNPAAPEEENTESEPVELCTELCIKFSPYLRPFDVPPYQMVALTALKHFQQEGMLCVPIRLGSEIIYKIILREPVEKNGQSLEFTSGGLTHSIPLYFWEKRPDQTGHREEGTLLTFRGAGEGRLAEIDATQYDKKVEEAGLRLIVPTKLQFIKDTRVLNGNRFCVVATPDDLEAIPESLTITLHGNPKIFRVPVTFKGQLRFCPRCNEKHVGQCPSLAEFYAAKQQKEEKRRDGEIRTKIFGSSTLRMADQLGLRADVCCMSGGGLGQIVQATLDDPSIGEFQNIVIMGGANDARDRNCNSNEFFAANIDRCLEKLVTAARDVPDKQFFVVNGVTHNADDGPVDDNLAIRQLYQIHSVQAKASAEANITAVCAQFEIDETGHPTDVGTAQIINQVNTAVNDVSLSLPLIWNPAFIVSDKAYRCVDSIYRYGCNSCKSYGAAIERERHSNQLICDTCYDELLGNGAHNELLAKITRSVQSNRGRDYDENFPPPKRTKSPPEEFGMDES